MRPYVKPSGTLPAYVWASNDHVFLAHALWEYEGGDLGPSMCGVVVAALESPPSIEKAAGRPRCGACKDSIERRKARA